MHMVQFGVNGEGDFACADSVTTVRTTATMMLALFILAVLILVNSLIAAMTKMFDEVWETQHVLVRCSQYSRSIKQRRSSRCRRHSPYFRCRTPLRPLL